MRSVKDVVERPAPFFGKVVRVRGWLIYRCQPLSCSIYVENDPESRSLSIGASNSFDRALLRTKAEGREVIVQAVVTPDCFPDPDPDIIRVCTDRADNLSKPRLVKVLPLSIASK